MLSAGATTPASAAVGQSEVRSHVISSQQEDESITKESSHHGQNPQQPQQPQPHAPRLVLRTDPRELEEARKWRCDCRVFTDFLCFRRCQRTLEPLEIGIPIKSVEKALAGPFAFDLLREEISEFLIQKAWDAPLHRCEIHITFQTWEDNDLPRTREIQVAVKNSFRYFGTMTHYESLRAGAEGWYSVLLALGIYIVCLACIIPLFNYYNETGEVWAYTIYDLLYIVLWVVVWHPVEILIFSRLMINRRKLVCRTLEDAKVRLEILQLDNLLFVKGGIHGGIEVVEDLNNQEEQQPPVAS